MYPYFHKDVYMILELTPCGSHVLFWASRWESGCISHPWHVSLLLVVPWNPALESSGSHVFFRATCIGASIRLDLVWPLHCCPAQEHTEVGQQDGELDVSIGCLFSQQRQSVLPIWKSLLLSIDHRGSLMCPNLGCLLTLASKKCLSPLVGCKEAVTKPSGLASQELLATALPWQGCQLELCALSGRATAWTPQFWRLITRQWQSFHQKNSKGK